MIDNLRSSIGERKDAMEDLRTKVDGMLKVVSRAAEVI